MRRSDRPALTQRLSDQHTDGEAIGPKLARLNELRALGCAVPSGFALTTAAFDHFVRHNRLHDELRRIERELPDDDPVRLRQAGNEARRLLDDAAMPTDVVAALTSAHRRLCEELGVSSCRLAVRSSATGEDSADASFAGQYASILGAQMHADLLQAVKAVWRSVFEDRAMHYRLQAGRSYADSPMAVGIMELIDARAAGVGFSVDPVSGKRDRCVIEANWGYGEAVVQGVTTPDRISIDKQSDRVLSYRIGSKSIYSNLDQSTQRVIETDTPNELRERAVLCEPEVFALTAVLRDLEARTGHPVDIEWVRRPDESSPPVIVQMRPVTALAEPPATTSWSPLKAASRWRTTT